jgi:hypothetical protein
MLPVSPPRRIAGLVVGGFLALSAFAHSLLGGAELRAELTAAQVPQDLLRGALIGWYFGGAAMLAFSALVLHTFARRTEGAVASLVPARIVALTYLLFGLVAFAVSGFDPFFLVFVIPALLLSWAAFPARRAASQR